MAAPLQSNLLMVRTESKYASKQKLIFAKFTILTVVVICAVPIRITIHKRMSVHATQPP
jgi:hypothetical protein